MERKSLIQQLDQLEQLAQTSKATKQLFACTFQPMPLNKDQQLSCPNQPHRSLYFIYDGLLHLYKQNQNYQKDKNISKSKRNSSEIIPLQFYRSGQFFSLPQHPQDSHWNNIQLSAFRPSQLLTAGYQQLKQALLEDPQLFDILYALHAHLLTQEHQRIELLTTTPATRRYQLLSHAYGKDLYHIPRYLLARYLGISRKHLVRINFQQLRLQKT